MRMRVLIEFDFPDNSDRMNTPAKRKAFHAAVLTVIEKHQFAIPGTLVYLQTDKLAQSDTKIWQNFNGK